MTGTAHGSAAPTASCNAMDIATATGKPAPEASNCASPNYEKAAISLPSSTSAAIPRAARAQPWTALPRRTAEKALTAVIQEACIHGVSTRSVDDRVQAMGASGVSKSQVSRLCGKIDGRVNAFLSRPIEGEWPYLWLDATYI